MNESFLSTLTLLYAIAGLVAISAFLPTVKDLILDKKNTANPKTYFMWTITNTISSLYGIFIVHDWIFASIAGIASILCIIILTSSIYLTKKGITHVTPTL